MLSSSTTSNKHSQECTCACNTNKNRRPSSSRSYLHHHQTPRAMEDVWKEINLSSLNTSTHSHPITTTSSNLRCVNFQEFLTRPLTFTIAVDSPARSASPSPTLTALSLTPFDPLIRHNNKDFQLPQLPRHHHLPNQNQHLFSNSVPSFGSKRPLHQSDSNSSNNNNSGDRRNKRMIKNRESAARSRARKQAYTFELQQKVKHLQEENARLKRQQQLLCETAANNQQKKKKKGNLYRTYTAPF